jgi:hypothetical protein
MKQTILVARLRVVRVAIFSLLAAVISLGAAQAETASYQLDNVFLADGSQMTGAFDWVYTIGDFEGGSGVFTALEIPWHPNGTAPPLEQAGMNLTIEDKQIEISLDGNFHDYGLDISLKFEQPLSPTQSSLIDTGTSFFECCGNGFKDQPFTSGSISLAQPVIVNIDIQLAQTDNYIHINHNDPVNLDDVISVGVLGSLKSVGDPIDFVVGDIDPATVRFGPAQGAIDPASLPELSANVDGDGIDDATFEFLTSDVGISCGETTASLVGETISGQQFQGTDTITTQCKAGCH